MTRFTPALASRSKKRFPAPPEARSERMDFSGFSRKIPARILGTDRYMTETRLRLAPGLRPICRSKRAAPTPPAVVISR
jgi:hypothetical protein